MSNLVQELSQKARLLSPEERVQLAEELLATVQESDPEVEAAWEDEIRRCIAEIESGTAKLIPAAEVFAEVRRLLKCNQFGFVMPRAHADRPNRRSRLQPRNVRSRTSVTWRCPRVS